MDGWGESCGNDHAYEHDMRIEYLRGAQDALKTVLAVVRARGGASEKDAREIAERMGVEL